MRFISTVQNKLITKKDAPSGKTKSLMYHRHIMMTMNDFEKPSIVIVIYGILATVAIPRLTEFKSIAEESSFNQFLIDNFDEACPSGGAITYADGKVKCSVHETNDEENEGPGEEVPWL